MEMVFTAHLVLLRISTIVILLSVITSCAIKSDRLNEFNVAQVDIQNKNGVIFKDGKPLTGMLYALSDQSDTMFTREYREGLENGIHRMWYPNCVVQEVRFYSSGKKVGTHLGYWGNGQRKYQYNFKNDLFEETQYEWYMDGKPFSKKEYKDGHEHGLQQTWTIDGKLRSNYEAKNGRNYGNIGRKGCFKDM
jgi:antitoxin component YwqK of YwqJK toxin-antitoxin module